ncbi:hypothetical protein ANANG_G00181070 [Anguilla anguilla]|uniref:Proline rich mitotic checkpoint control factor n=1 Tax=Anguilla anguilla TaxID=7936 RepID=A0A9D3M6L2_ANGAN|nr:hypothetical protein ANANG_G00181070 [Anguilla anguilla]
MGLNLPPPKRDTSQRSGSPQIPASFMSDMDPGQNLDPKGAHPPISSGLHLNLPKPKKRTEPVKITIPELQRGDSDSEEEEPVTTKPGRQGDAASSGAAHPDQAAPGAAGPAPSRQRCCPAPGRLRLAVRHQGGRQSAALQLARQIAQEDEGSDEELAPRTTSPSPRAPRPPVLPARTPTPRRRHATLPLPPGTEPPFQSDAPLEFSSAPQIPGSSGAWEEHQQEAFYPRYPESSSQGTEQQPLSQDYYSGGYYQDPEPAATEVEGPGSSSLFDDEAFRRLQGKRNRGKEEVKFLEIKGDDQLSGSQQWMTKSMTEEKEQRKSFSKKKGEQPTGQQRRKHQITYLIHQAKERELELKNSWAENKLTRRQTQAKYGF